MVAGNSKKCANIDCSAFFLYLKFRFTLASAVFQINILFGVGIAQVRQFERLRFAHHGDDIVAIGAFQQTVAG